MEWGLIEEFLAKNFEIGNFFTKMSENANFFCLKTTKNHVKPHQNPMGIQLKSPTPGVFQSQFPTPMGDGGGDPMGPPWCLGVGGKTY